MAHRRETPAVFLGLILLAALGFARLVGEPGSLLVDAERGGIDHAGHPARRPVGNDLTFFHLPRFLKVVDAWRTEGRPVLWDDAGFGGRPLVGNPQAGLFYPPAWLGWASGHPASLGWLTVGHLVWAGLAAYFLARALGCSPFPSFVAAVGLQFSPYMQAHAMEGHYPHVWGAAWYPWAFLAFLGVVRGNAWTGLALPFALALAFLTGHAQEWYWLVVALGCWGAVESAARLARGEPRGASRLVLVAGAGMAICLGLTAIEWMPVADALRWVEHEGAIPVGRINHYYLHSLNLLQLLSPFALGRPADYFGHDNYWETVWSAGLTPLVCAGIGILGWRGSRTRRGLVALVLASSALAAGRKLPLFPLLFRVLPGMNRFRVPSRTLFLASLGVALLAGLGLEWLSRRGGDPNARRRLERGLLGGAVCLALALAAARVLLGPVETLVLVDSARDTLDASKRWERALQTLAVEPSLWLALLGTILTGVWVRLGPIRARSWAIGLGLVAIVELVVGTRSLVHCAPLDRLVEHCPELEQLMPSGGEWRVAASPRSYPDLEAARARVPKILVNDSFQLGHVASLHESLYRDLDDEPWESRPRPDPMGEEVERFRDVVARSVLDRLGARVIATTRAPRAGVAETARGVVRSGRQVYLAVNPSAMPRAYVVPRALGVDVGEPMPLAVRLSRVDPRAGVLLDSDPLPEGPRQEFTPATRLEGPADRVVVEVETRAPGLLVVANAWMPGWSARVNGVVERVERGDGWLQVVSIRRAGRHVVELSYQPPSLVAGALVSASSLGLWGVAAAVLVVGRARRRCDSDPAMSLAQPPFQDEDAGEDEEERPVVPHLALGERG